MSETASADAHTASDDRVLLEAEFNPNVKTYWLLSGVIILLVCVVTIPLIPVWWILGMAFTDRYLSSLSCVLTERNLKVSKGVFVRQEKTVPLEKITDLGLVQGPIMRHLELEALSVETAGGTTAGALVQMEARGVRTLALTPASDATALDDVDHDGRTALLLGEEGPGLSEAAMSGASVRVRIDTGDCVDSLNVAAAGAIAMHAFSPRRYDARHGRS